MNKKNKKGDGVFSGSKTDYEADLQVIILEIIGAKGVFAENFFRRWLQDKKVEIHNMKGSILDYYAYVPGVGIVR